MNTVKQKSKWKLWHFITVGSIILIFILFGRFVNYQTNKGDAAYEASLTQTQKDSIAFRKKIAPAFSEWDGSHKELVEFIKNRVNDPDGFEHVQTKFWHIGKTVVINMTYRGKNAFNATITEVVNAEADEDGKLTKVFNK